MNPGPPDDLVEAIRIVLRGYPEVEWACAALIIHGSDAGIPTIAVRVDPTYRARKDELLGKVRETCSNYGTQIAVTGMDDPTLLKAARQSAYMFYPWKR